MQAEKINAFASDSSFYIYFAALFSEFRLRARIAIMRALVVFKNQKVICSPASSEERVAPAAGRDLVLYLEGFAKRLSV